MHGLTTLISLLYNAMFKLIKDNKFNLLKVPINDGLGKTQIKVTNNYYIPRVSSKTVSGLSYMIVVNLDILSNAFSNHLD